MARPRSISALVCLLTALAASAQDSANIHSRLEGLGGPGTVVLEPRIYEVDRTIELKSGQVLIGVEGATTIVWRGGNAPVIRAKGTSGAVIGMLTADPAAPAGYALRLNGPAPAQVRVAQAWDSDIPVHELVRLRAESKPPHLMDRLINDFTTGGELRAITPVERARIIGITIDGSARAAAGIALTDTSYAEVRNCTIENARFGVDIADSYFPSVTQTFIRNTTVYGVSVSRSTGCEIARNRIVDNISTAISLSRGTWQARVDGNDIVGAWTDDKTAELQAGDGITLFGVGNTIIVNNRILRTGCYGVWAIRHVYNLVVQNNVVMGGGTGGMHFNGNTLSNGTVRGLQLLGNIVLNNLGTAVILNPARDALAAQNIVDGHMNRDGVLAYGEHGAASVNSEIRDNLVYRDPSTVGLATVDTADRKTGAYPLWPASIPSPVDWERFVDYTVRGVPAKTPVFVENIGIGSAGAWLQNAGGVVTVTTKDGVASPPPSVDLLRDPAVTRPERFSMPAGAADMEIASISGDELRKRLATGPATLKLTASDPRYRIDVFADDARITIAPFRKITSMGATAWQFVSDADLGAAVEITADAKHYRFMLIDQSGDNAAARIVAVPTMTLVAGTWPFPLNARIIQRIEPRH